MGNRNVIGEGIFRLARRALAAVKLYGSQTGLLDKFTHVGKRQEGGFSEGSYFFDCLSNNRGLSRGYCGPGEWGGEIKLAGNFQIRVVFKTVACTASDGLTPERTGLSAPHVP